MSSASVYLSKSLSEAVKRLGIPVSSVCQQALRDEVRKLEALERFHEKDAVREGARRLRGARGTESQEAQAEGYDCGLDWAINVAEEPELRAAVEISKVPWVTLHVTEEEWPTLFRELESLDGRSYTDEDIHWEREPFMLGFVRGAVDAYWAMLAEEVRSDLGT
jgi:post-segregation antitoxin (ccd killing protein)